MKNFFTLALFAANSVTAFAGMGDAELHLRTSGMPAVTVSFDQAMYQSAWSGQVDIHCIVPGQHFVRISRIAPNASSWTNSNVTIYEGYLNFAPFTETFATINRFRQFTIDQVINKQPEPVVNNGWNFYNNYYNGNYSGYNGYTGYTSGGCGTQASYNTGGYDDHCASGMMDANAFQQFFTIVQNQWFESTQKQLILDQMSRARFSTAQVHSLLMLFDFDSNKLEVAKAAYLNVVDPQNFFQLLDVFSFESNVAELSQYINHH